MLLRIKKNVMNEGRGHRPTKHRESRGRAFWVADVSTALVSGPREEPRYLFSWVLLDILGIPLIKSP